MTTDTAQENLKMLLLLAMFFVFVSLVLLTTTLWNKVGWPAVIFFLPGAFGLGLTGIAIHIVEDDRNWPDLVNSKEDLR